MIYGNRIPIHFDCGCSGRFGANSTYLGELYWKSHVDGFHACNIHIKNWEESIERREKQEDTNRLKRLEAELKDLINGKRKTHSYSYSSTDSYYYEDNPEPYNLIQKLSCGCWFEGHKELKYISIVDHKLCDIHIKTFINGYSRISQEELNKDLENLRKAKFYSHSEFEEDSNRRRKERIVHEKKTIYEVPAPKKPIK